MADLHDHTLQPSTKTGTKAYGQYELKETEHVEMSAQNPIFDEEEVEPEFHARTWIALAAFLLLNYTQVAALQGPSAIVSGQ